MNYPFISIVFSRSTLITTILLVFLSFNGAEEKKRPNILLILSDDLRDTLACYGHPEVKTPNLDALAKSGVRFSNAYNQYPVCNPSRSSFLTGIRPETTRLWGNAECFRAKNPDVITLPQAFRNAGYYTASYGKVFHVGHGAPSQEIWMDTKNSWSEAVYIPNITPDMPKEYYFAGKKSEPDLWGPTVGPEENQPDAQIATQAIEAMKKSGNKPWFVAAGFHRPHSPYVCPQKYFDLYNPKKIKPYEDPVDMSPTPPLSIPEGSGLKHYKSFTDEDKRNHIWAYLACISFMDAQVGRILDSLKKNGMMENTIIVFTGDNGFHLGERQWWTKMTLFERSCRIPFIMAGPGIVKDRVCQSPIELIDLFPTLTEFSKVKGPDDLQGESFKGLLENPEGAGKGYAFTMVSREEKEKVIGRSVCTARWRYTEWDEGRQGIELYDKANDPEETHDLSKNPEYKTQIESLKKIFHRLPKIGARPDETLKK